MSTDYYIKCIDDTERWPDDMLPSYTKDDLLKLLDPDVRRHLKSIFSHIMKINNFATAVEIASGIYPKESAQLCEYMYRHRRCRLVVMDEYGEPYPRKEKVPNEK